MSDDDLFDDEDSFAEAVANLDDSLVESSSSAPCNGTISSTPPQSTSSSRIFASQIEDDDEEENVPSSKALTLLKQFYGYSSFRHVQWKIIRSVTEDKRDHCVVMATGSGKSLTYQFPALLTEKVSVVISPLISLMEDQVMALEVSNSSTVKGQIVRLYRT